MTRFDFCFEHVVGLEGGHVNDPADAGGETRYGITRRDHAAAWLTGPPTLEQAKAIYDEQYWRAAGCDKLPAPWDLLAFDAAVNQGRWAAIQAIQAAIGIEQDGRVGPQTIAACTAAGKEQVALALAHRARKYATTRGFDRFGLGWLKRTYLIAMATGE